MAHAIGRGTEVLTRDKGTNPEDRRTRLPSALLLFSGVAGLIFIGVSLALYAAGARAVGLFIAVCVPAGWVLLLVAIALARWRAARESPVDANGIIGAGSRRGPSRRGDPREELQHGVPCRWTGGVNVPAAVGRISSSLPIGVLELTGATLVFGTRPRIIRRLFGTQTLTITRGDEVTIFPVRRLVGMGVGIRPLGQPTWYFWTNAGGEVLQALASAGFEVSRGVQKRAGER
jgi:hypothetical protein